MILGKEEENGGRARLYIRDPKVRTSAEERARWIQMQRNIRTDINTRARKTKSDAKHDSREEPQNPGSTTYADRTTKDFCWEEEQWGRVGASKTFGYCSEIDNTLEVL